MAQSLSQRILPVVYANGLLSDSVRMVFYQTPVFSEYINTLYNVSFYSSHVVFADDTDLFLRLT